MFNLTITANARTKKGLESHLRLVQQIIDRHFAFGEENVEDFSYTDDIANGPTLRVSFRNQSEGRRKNRGDAA